MRHTRPLRRGLLKPIPFFAIVLGTLFLAASGDCVAPPMSTVTDEMLGDRPLAQLTESQQNVAFEDQGTIIVFHGFGCAKADQTGRQVTLKVEQSIDVPSYAKKATVFLNGWRLEYVRGGRHVDHHVRLLKTAIRRVTFEGQTLRWEAIGELSDGDREDTYVWCYHFTAFAWEPARINIAVDDQDGARGSDDTIQGEKFFAAPNGFGDSAGASFLRFVVDPAGPSGKPVAILPRGFMFVFGDNDHHLLQIAYNVDHSERFIDGSRKYFNQAKDHTPIENHNVSRVDSEFATWETAVIFKDDDQHRDYSFGELVSVLSGPDLGLIQPPFFSEVVRPNCWLFCAATLKGRTKTEEFVIENIPFEYAIPVLTGWELRYVTRDQHVGTAGVWIDEAHYSKDPVTQLGRLRYTLSSVLVDSDGFPDFASRHRVTVVGMRPLSSEPPIRLTR